jgi:hypothetical protein
MSSKNKKKAPTAPVMQTAQQTIKQLSPEEQNWYNTQNRVTNQFSDLLAQTTPYYQSYLNQQGGLQNARLKEATDLEGLYASELRKYNTLSPEFQNQLNNTINLYKQQAGETLAETYNPIFARQTAGLVSRLGGAGLGSSIANQQLADLTRQQSKSANELVNQIELNRQNIAQQQLANQANYLNALQSGSNYYRGLAQEPLSFISSAIPANIQTSTGLSNLALNRASGLAGVYNQNQLTAYDQALNDYNAQKNKKGWSGALTGAGSGAAAGSSIGPYGALAGALVGGVGGYYAPKSQQQQLSGNNYNSILKLFSKK